MKQFETNAGNYERIRAKITYPDELYTHLATLCDSRLRALDIGCGNGVSTIRLKSYFTEVVGVDLGATLINYAKNSFPEISFIVGQAEDIEFEQKFDLVTSATSFYWMNRKLLIKKMSHWLNPEGVFCAYKYDFPIVYGQLQDFILSELVNKWGKYRDRRLVDYDNTLELMQESQIFVKTRRFLIPNIIELSPEEVGYFFLSTSYVSKYIKETGDTSYPIWFMTQIREQGGAGLVKVNFDICAYFGKVL